MPPFPMDPAESHEIRFTNPMNILSTLREALADSIDRLTRINELKTGIESIDERLAGVLRRAHLQYEKFLDTDEPVEALRNGTVALSELARGTSDVRPSMRGAILDAGNPQRSHFEEFMSLLDRIEENENRWRQEERAFWAVERSTQAAYEATTAASALREAAGEEGAARLEEAFEAYAEGERTSAVLFRRWTIILLVLVAVLGAFAAVLPAIFPSEADVPWQVVVYRISVLTALSALAAYLGRQSGRHRTAAAWADAIAVQLRAFPAFIQPIRGEKIADAIYEAFGKRVMGSPPDFTGKSDDAVNPTMAALIDALVKQARPTP